MKKLLIIFVLGGVLVTGLFVGANTLGSSKAELQCQPGEFDAGGFCRTVPTSCVHGDSLSPEVCEKFNEPVETQVNNEPVVQEEKAIPQPTKESQCK